MIACVVRAPPLYQAANMILELDPNLWQLNLLFGFFWTYISIDK